MTLMMCGVGEYGDSDPDLAADLDVTPIWMLTPIWMPKRVSWMLNLAK